MVGDDWRVDYGVSNCTKGYVSPGQYVFLVARLSYKLGMMNFPPTNEW